MFEELNNLLMENVTEDAWYDDGCVIAKDILSEFSEDDWNCLKDVILSRNSEWQKKIVYCLDNQLIEEELKIICKLLQSDDNELLEMCIDSLRSFDNEVGHKFMKKNPQVIQMVKNRIKGAGIVEKKMMENFLIIFDK